MRDRRTTPIQLRPAVVLPLVLAIGLAAACGVPGQLPISTERLSGRIGGADWTLGSAESIEFLSRSDQFFVDAYAETVTPCAGAGNAISTNRLILNIPKATGDYPLTIALTETFYVPAGATNVNNSNYITSQGRMVVDEVTATMVRGGAHFIYDNDNYVDGQFQAQICPPSP